MPLVTERNAVLKIYADAAENRWVIPTICSENLTTTEAILAAAREHAEAIGQADLPITIAMTNLYSHRSQSINYTHTARWDIGLKLFLADLRVLTEQHSPFGKLNVLVHLDHIQPGPDSELLGWNMQDFSSIMFDASALPFEENIRVTRDFVEQHNSEIVIEGACDEVVDKHESKTAQLTTPERAALYLRETNADLIVANLGTEHRASAADLKYHGELARQIKARIGTKMVLHGCSSVPPEQLKLLFDDGVCKINIWTMLERDSSPILFRDMVTHAAKVAGPTVAQRLRDDGFLGNNCDVASRANLEYFTTRYRQQIVFGKMKQIVRKWLALCLR